MERKLNVIFLSKSDAVILASTSLQALVFSSFQYKERLTGIKERKNEKGKKEKRKKGHTQKLNDPTPRN